MRFEWTTNLGLFWTDDPEKAAAVEALGLHRHQGRGVTSART